MRILLHALPLVYIQFNDTNNQRSRLGYRKKIHWTVRRSSS